MEELPREDVERTARLAGLELSEESAARLAGEMASILGHFGEIRRLGQEADDAARAGGPATGGSPGEDPEAAGALRDDDVDPDALERSPSAMAPEWREGHFVVPRLPSLGEEGDG